MAKRRDGSQTVSLIPDKKKLGIDPIYLAFEDMRHIIGELLMRATTLLQTTSRSEVRSQSYGVPKSWESQPAQFQDSHLGVLGEKNHLDVGSMTNHRVYYKGEGCGVPPSPGCGEFNVSVLPMVCPSTKGAPTMH
jgi:hypothetical protein